MPSHSWDFLTTFNFPSFSAQSSIDVCQIGVSLTTFSVFCYDASRSVYFLEVFLDIFCQFCSTVPTIQSHGHWCSEFPVKAGAFFDLLQILLALLSCLGLIPSSWWSIFSISVSFAVFCSALRLFMLCLLSLYLVLTFLIFVILHLFDVAVYL